MKCVWTWNGKAFGYLDEQDLWSYSGKHVGKLKGNEIYASDGSYLGELVNHDRLVTCAIKRGQRDNPFPSSPPRRGIEVHADRAGCGMCAGHEEFPYPNSL